MSIRSRYGEAKMSKKRDDRSEVEKAPHQTPAAIAGKPATPQVGTFRYIDRPDCTETFADSINNLSYDGQSLRIEFGITRVDEMKANTPVTGRRYPACRLVLSPAAAVDLINKIQQVAAALVQAGVVKSTPTTPNANKPE
jgi:hypothetical protein